MVASKRRSVKLIAALTTILLIKKRRKRRELEETKRRRKRRVWVKSCFAQRGDKGEGTHAKFLRELADSDSSSDINSLHIHKDDYNLLLEMITPLIKKETTLLREAISPSERLMITLCFLTTGKSYNALMHEFRIPVCTISGIVPEVCDAIYKVLKTDYLKFPNSNADWLEIAAKFHTKWDFPNCIGAIDGKHVVMRQPANSGDNYLNYKGSHSIVILGLVDADSKFLYIDVGCAGRISNVFTCSPLSIALEENRVNAPVDQVLPGSQNMEPLPFVIVGNDALPLKNNILKSYPLRNQREERRIFNTRISRARTPSKNAFGMLGTRFRCFRRPIELAPERVKSVVLGACALHNFLMSSKSSSAIYAPQGMLDEPAETNCDVTHGLWRDDGMPPVSLLPLCSIQTRNPTVVAKAVRDAYAQYFMSPGGEIPFQYQQE